jgi:hypothetical protein
MEKYCKKILHYRENQPGGDQKSQCSCEHKNPRVQPTKADMEKDSCRGDIMTSTPGKKKKQQDLRVKVLKNIMLQRLHSEEEVSYAYKSSPVKPEPNTAAASTVVCSWARDADNDLRALILHKRGYRNSRDGAEAQAIILEEIKRGRLHKGYHYSSQKETRKGQLKRKNTDAAGGPAFKRTRFMLLSFILEDSKDTVQALGNITSDASSDLPKMKSEIFSDDMDDILVLDIEEDLLAEMEELINSFKL